MSIDCDIPIVPYTIVHVYITADMLIHYFKQ